MVISLKQIILTVLLFCTGLFTLLSLCFPALTISATFVSGSINGFDIISDRASSGRQLIYVIIQIIDIALLIMGIACIVLSVLYFFIGNKAPVLKAVRVMSLISVILYTLTGIALAVYHTIGGGDYDTSTYGTLAFIPLILVVAFMIAFAVVNRKMPDDCGFVLGNGAVKSKDGGSPAAPKKAKTVLADYDALVKIKELYDMGVLTEEEFKEEKNKILNKDE